jgi:hypothetical protein
MREMRQFPKSDCKFGAPMGRQAYGKPIYPVRLFKLNIDSGGYDDGGNYWGIGKPLYMATGDDYQAFQRANSRKEAAELLKITVYLKVQP